jgi:hypothetical protein
MHFMGYDPLLVSMGYIWRLQGLPPDSNPSFRYGYELGSRELRPASPPRWRGVRLREVVSEAPAALRDGDVQQEAAVDLS